MRLLGRLLLCCACALCIVFPSAAQDKAEARTLVIGLMPYLSTRTLMANYQPVADALQQSLKQPVTLLTAPNFDVFVERVLNGDYDVVLLAPHYARLAIKDYGYAPLLLHKAPIRGILVTGKDAPLKSFDELRGHNIAIVDRSALIVIAGALTLAENGLKENQDYRFIETVTHSSALHNAITGKARAASPLPRIGQVTSSPAMNCSHRTLGSKAAARATASGKAAASSTLDRPMEEPSRAGLTINGRPSSAGKVFSRSAGGTPFSKA